MNGTQQNGKPSNITNMIYIMLVTFIIDNINRYTPVILKYIEKQYTKKIEDITYNLVSIENDKSQKCSNKTLLEMIEFFYDTKLADEYITRIKALIPHIITPAEMSKIMFENFNDCVNTIIQLENISQKEALEQIIENQKKIEYEKLQNLCEKYNLENIDDNPKQEEENKPENVPEKEVLKPIVENPQEKKLDNNSSIDILGDFSKPLPENVNMYKTDQNTNSYASFSRYD